MKNLPAQLSAIPDLHHAIYADDITLWCCTGSPGSQEETLQKGLDVVHAHAQSIGLACSATKTEYVVVSDDSRKTAQAYRDLIKLHVNGFPIPRRPHIKVLGFVFQQDGRSTVWTPMIIKQVEQVHQMIRRITRQRRGLQEHELRKVIEALVYSRVMYALFYQKLTATQLQRLETALRKCTRTALGVPSYAPNFKL